MLRYFSLALSLALSAAVVNAAEKEQGCLENCGTVMEEIVNLPDSIPQELLEEAECVVVIPSVMKVAVGIGGSGGRGAMVCRSGKKFNGPWGAPAMYALEAGSVGLQLAGVGCPEGPTCQWGTESTPCVRCSFQNNPVSERDEGR